MNGREHMGRPRHGWEKDQGDVDWIWSIELIDLVLLNLRIINLFLAQW